MTTLAVARIRFDRYSDMPGPSCAANEQMHLARRTALGQEHDGLPGRVTRAHDRDVGAVVQVRFDGRTGIVDARSGKAIRSARPQAAASELRARAE